MPEKFSSPRPRWLVRQLDAWTAGAVRRRRSQASEAAAGLAAVAPDAPPCTRGEEIANWVTHGLGLMMSTSGLTLLIVFSSLRGDAWCVVSFTVFGLTLLMLYMVSTLYQAWRTNRTKGIFHRLDRAATFLLIAGTYTPFLLTHLRSPWGWTLFGVVWGLCGAGAVFQLIFGERYRLASTLAYLFLGWSIVVVLKPLIAAVPHGGLWLLFAGGVCYTVGSLFHLWRRPHYHGAFRHAFVLGGSTCHLLAVLLFLLPRAH